MQELYELIKLLPQSFEATFSPRLNKMYVFLQEHPELSQEEATKAYLGHIDRIKYFRELKTDLKKAIIRYLMAFPSWHSNAQKAMYEESYRTFAMYKIFLINNKRTIAMGMAKKILPKLQKLELHQMAHAVADDLLIHHSVMDISVKMRKKYIAILEEERVHAISYSSVRQCYSRITAVCNTRESYTKAIQQEFAEIADQVRPLLHDKRHNTNRFIYNILVCRYIVVYDYPNIIKCCDEALNSFPKDHPNIKSFSFTFLFHKISALTALGKLLEAKQIARQVSLITITGNFNWHLVLIKRIIICFHLEEYQEAYQLFKAHKKQKIKYPTITEHWSIIRGYLHFLEQVGLIEPYAKERFYLGKFLNEVPLYSKDKAGNNINILLIQILIQMKRGQYIKIIERVESLREYARLYTRNKETKRANIFIKMILQMEAAGFNKKRTEAKTKSLLQKLRETPLRISQNIGTEIIPYEVVWEEMLQMLDNKFRSYPRRKKPNEVERDNIKN